MGRCSAIIREIRFVIEDDLTQAYVFVEGQGDCPIGVQGWHHKTFPSSVSVLDILEMERDGKEDHLLWSLEAPEE